jgi:hypothetical protein
VITTLTARVSRLTATIVIVVAMGCTPRAAADPVLIQCPDNTHIWADNPNDCDYDDGVTLGGGRGGNRCGGLCGILKHIPGLGGLLG